MRLGWPAVAPPPRRHFDHAAARTWLRGAPRARQWRSARSGASARWGSAAASAAVGPPAPAAPLTSRSRLGGDSCCKPATLPPAEDATAAEAHARSASASRLSASVPLAASHLHSRIMRTDETARAIGSRSSTTKRSEEALAPTAPTAPTAPGPLLGAPPTSAPPLLPRRPRLPKTPPPLPSPPPPLPKLPRCAWASAICRGASGAAMKVLIDGSSAYARAEASARRGHAWLMYTRGSAHARAPPAASHMRRVGSGRIRPQPGRTSRAPRRHSSGKRLHAAPRGVGAAAAALALASSMHVPATDSLQVRWRFSPRRHRRAPAGSFGRCSRHSHCRSGSEGPAYQSHPQCHPAPPQKLNSFFEPSVVSTWACSHDRQPGCACGPHSRFGSKAPRRQPKRKVEPLFGLPRRNRLGRRRSVRSGEVEAVNAIKS